MGKATYRLNWPMFVSKKTHNTHKTLNLVYIFVLVSVSIGSFGVKLGMLRAKINTPQKNAQ